MTVTVTALQAQLLEARRERDAALAVNAAMARIAQRINEHPLDLDGTLVEIAEAARALTGGDGARVWLVSGDQLVPGPDSKGSSPGNVISLSGVRPQPLRTGEGVARAVRERRTVAFDDLLSLHRGGEWEQHMSSAGLRSSMHAPLGTGDAIPGALAVFRGEVRPFNGAEMAVLEAFAAQAAVAIDTARAQQELAQRNHALAEGLDRETATADILRIISQSPGDIERVLTAIGQAAERLCEADDVAITFETDGNLNIWDRIRGLRVAHDKWEQVPESQRATGVDQFAGPVDAWAADRPRAAEICRADGLTEAAVLRVWFSRAEPANEYILVRRNTARAFAPEHVSLLQRFAAQAVIAIDNARVFNELQARNHEISEALRREEAGSAILRQISRSPEELDQTLQEIAVAARGLTGMTATLGFLDGEFFEWRGRATIENNALAQKVGTRVRVDDQERRMMERREGFIHNWGEENVSNYASELSQRTGIRSWAFAPILRGDGVIGTLAVSNTTGEPIAEATLGLLRSFADQAAIAIENARLIRELRESNREVSEALDVQKVMSDVLAIVASAPADLDATLPQIAAAARRLCECSFVAVVHVDGAEGRVWDTTRGSFTTDHDPLNRRSIANVAIAENRLVEVTGPVDEWADRFPQSAEASRRAGHTTEVARLAMPLPGREGAVGAILVGRATPFTARHKGILEALANQAVIAIENARLFNQLRSKTQELEVASRHKSEFLANMSHELRTPLNAIIGYAELLQEECADLGHENFLPDLGKIHTAGKHLLTLISGILDLSKVEAGRMTMFLEDFDVASLVRDVDSIVRPLVEKNRNEFVIDCPADLGVMHADLVKVRQVLFNLLSNAAKFTEGGRITLTARRQTAPATCTFAIRDTGIGITEEQRGRLFEAFGQAEAHTSRKYGGTGLGLALSRQFCRMMGGDIGVTSEAGVGSVFTMTLPSVVNEPEAAPNPDPIATQRS